MGTAVGLQWLLILALAAGVGLWRGEQAAGFLFLGGASVALPNAALALWLTLRLYRAGVVGVVAMFAGELLKLGCTIALLVLIVARQQPDAGAWLALLVGVVVALKAQWLALWFTRRF